MKEPTTYSFKTFDNPADTSFAAMEGIPTFTNLLGINNKGLIAGFYGSGNAGDPNQGFLLKPPSTFTPGDFPPTSQNPALQTQLTGLNDKGIVVGYFYNTNNGVPVDNQFGFYEKDGVFTEVNNPNTPGLFNNPSPNNGVLIENQLIGVNDHNIAVGFYNDASGNSHGYTYDIKTGKFSANIDDPNANSKALRHGYGGDQQQGRDRRVLHGCHRASFTVSWTTMASSRPSTRPARPRRSSLD